MLKRFDFSEFTPDRPLSLSQGRNVWAMPNGYRPVRGFEAQTPPLPGFLGGAAYISSDGTTALLAGTSTNLYRYSGSAWASVVGGLVATVWRFDQFGDLVIGVRGDVPIKFDLIGGSAGLLGGSPPVSDMVATVRQQVFLAGDPDARNTLAISSYNNSEGWTSGVNQCLYVPFPSGGDIMGLAGGETGVILQQRSIKRATYNGDGVTWWQFDEISKDLGCMAKGSIATSGQMVFFLSEKGFMVTDRNTVIPIGQEKVDREFFTTYSRTDIQRITAAVDPRTTTVSWSMPGTPGQIWSYNWALEKWSPPIEQSLLAVFPGFTANISLDAIDALYPGGIDNLPFSLDATILAGGNPLFMVVDAAGTIGTLSGLNMPANFTVQAVEVNPGTRVRIRGARAVTDAIEGVVTVDVRARAGDPPHNVISGAIRDNGRVPLRANGRHVGMMFDIPASADWTYALGMDLEFEQEGAR